MTCQQCPLGANPTQVYQLEDAFDRPTVGDELAIDGVEVETNEQLPQEEGEPSFAGFTTSDAAEAAPVETLSPFDGYGSLRKDDFWLDNVSRNSQKKRWYARARSLAAVVSPAR